MDGEPAFEVDDEGVKVRRWRQCRLEQAGFSEFTAFRISCRFDVPYQRAIRLLELGMSEQQVCDQLIDD